jgi:hypothetical protein
VAPFKRPWRSGGSLANIDLRRWYLAEQRASARAF